MQCTLFSSLPKGTKVHTKDCIVVLLTEDKSWKATTFSGVVVYGDYEGRYEKDWCADVFYTHEHYPCDDSIFK